MDKGANGFWKGVTETRVTTLECDIKEIKAELYKQTNQLESIQRKLSYIYGVAGGIGIIAGMISGYIFDKIFK